MSAKHSFRALWSLLILAIAAWIAAPHLGAVNTAKLPSMVVKANNGVILGPVIGIDAGNDRPVILFDDPTVGGRPVPMLVDKHAFRPAEFQMFYSGMNCTGTAYIRPPEDRVGLRQMTGIIYAVGVSSGDVWLFRGSGAVASHAYMSQYTASSADYATPASGCTNSSSSLSSVIANPVVNITTGYPPPYSAEF